MHYALIFDYDGVLVDSLDIFMKNFISACRKYGWNNIASKDEFLNLFENNMYDSMFALGMTRNVILQIVNTLKISLLRDQEKIFLFPEIKETIGQLADKNALFIVTSNETDVVAQYMKTQNLLYFQEIIGSDKGSSKVNKIIKIKNGLDGYRCIYIGDTVGDIIEGKKAGIPTVAVTWGWHCESRLKKFSPDFIVYSPKELIQLFSTAALYK